MSTRDAVRLTQETYRIARAQYDTLNAERKVAVDAIPAELDRYGDEFDDAVVAIETRLQTWEAFRVLCMAEVAMVDAVREAVAADRKLGARFAEVSIAFDKWQKSPKIRARMVDLCTRFAA